LTPKMIGGAMVGLQAAPMKMLLGPLINGFVNFEFWLPVPQLEFAGTRELMKKYQARAVDEHVDALGYYMAPWGYAQLQVLEQAVKATKGFDDQKLADYIRTTTFKTVVGDIKFGAKGEWSQSRMLQGQFRNIKGNDLAQFRDLSTEVVISPTEYATSAAIYPYAKAKQ
jgi:branched-chain amino acid transport system substrate-binding protein